MAEKYEFPEELRLITDKPIEEDGWGESRSDASKAEGIIRYLADFIMTNECWLSPTFDLDKEISKMVKSRFCPIDRKRGECTCIEAIIELKNVGCSKCGIFATEQHLFQDHDIGNLQISKEKTRALLKTYKRIDSGIPVILAYHGFHEK